MCLAACGWHHASFWGCNSEKGTDLCADTFMNVPVYKGWEKTALTTKCYSFCDKIATSIKNVSRKVEPFSCGKKDGLTSSWELGSSAACSDKRKYMLPYMEKLRKVMFCNRKCCWYSPWLRQSNPDSSVLGAGDCAHSDGPKCKLRGNIVHRKLHLLERGSIFVINQ